MKALMDQQLAKAAQNLQPIESLNPDLPMKFIFSKLALPRRLGVSGLHLFHRHSVQEHRNPVPSRNPEEPIGSVSDLAN
jgi:hypothetical protein